MFTNFQLWILENSPAWLLDLMRYYCLTTFAGLSFLAGYGCGKENHESPKTKSLK